MKSLFGLSLFGVLGILALATRGEAANPLGGTWRQSSADNGESDWKFRENEDGTFDAEESGLGNTRGTATLRDDILTIHFEAADLRGYFVFHLNEDRDRGRGKIIFIHYPPDFPVGREIERDGRKLREVNDVLIKRVGR
ncbi:MAG TPA: hypothetical protein VMS17_16845 [Gemmataceae bacterium]|nr:hypothetical protein [Gemmataceae bacterium]